MIYSSEEYRQARDTEMRSWIEDRVKIIDTIEDNYFESICYFSLLECFVQEYSGYPIRGVADAFCTFVLKFQKNYDFLEKIDPVTLYYDFEDQLKGRYNLSFLEEGKTLFDQIDNLISEKILPEMMKDVLDVIRIFGNEAAHGDEVSFSLYDVEQLIDYVATVINYLYSLPARVKRQKERFEG